MPGPKTSATPAKPAVTPAPGPRARRAAEEVIGTKLARRSFERSERAANFRVLTSVGAALCISLLMNGYQATRPMPTRYIATDANGKILALRALDQPVGTESSVATWTSQAVTNTLTFDFANYRKQLSDAQANFTPDGWVKFEKGLKEANFLQHVIDNQYVRTATPTSAPQLVTSGLLDGRFAWEYTFSVLLTDRSANASNQQSYPVTVVVVRQPETEQSTGLGIAKFIIGQG